MPAIIHAGRRIVRSQTYAFQEVDWRSGPSRPVYGNEQTTIFLDCTLPIERPCEYRAGDIQEYRDSDTIASPAPINPDWTLDGALVARAQQIHRSKDPAADTFIRGCRAGRFNRSYKVHETVFMTEGSVVVRDEPGIYDHLPAGSAIFSDRIEGRVVCQTVRGRSPSAVFCCRVSLSPQGRCTAYSNA